MSTFTKILMALIAFSAMASCKKDNSFPANANSISDEIRSAPPGGNYWIARQNFPEPTVAAASFVINGKGYVFTGSSSRGVNILWEYDPSLNIWTQKASIPSTKYHRNPAAFVINHKAYLAGGHTDYDVIDRGTSRELWEYSQTTNSWRRLRDLPEGRAEATGFSINGKGYIAMGITGMAGADVRFHSDVLEYDPVTDSWRTKITLVDPSQNPARSKAISLVINNKAYIGLGWGLDVMNKADLWEFDPVPNVFRRKADIPEGRSGVFSFVIGSLGYVGTGFKGSPTGDVMEDKEFWSYNPSSNTWTRRADVPGPPRGYAFGFAIGSYGYAGAGYIDLYPSFRDDKFYRYIRSTASSTSN